MTFRFNYNRSSERELGRSAGMATLVGEMARRGASTARRNAPAGPTGRYRESIEAGTPRIGAHGFEAAFGSSDFAWHLVEFGSINNQPYRVLQRSARQLGLRFEDR